MQLERLIEFIGNHWELVLLFIGILAWLGYDIMLGNKGNIDPLDAVTMINRQDALVIDVRSTADFSKGHIVHAKNIPGNEILKQIKALKKYQDKPIIVNCNSGGQSSVVCKQLRQHNFTQVYNLSGGILGWENASLPISRKGY